MKNYFFSRVLPSIVLSAAFSPVQALTLNFSDGTYNPSNTVYQEGGFTLEASAGFYGIRLGTLAWYNGNNVIHASSPGNLFDLESLTIVDRAFAGLVFQSSKGGQVSVGSISGPLSFSGEQWRALSYFTITTITHADILNEIDNIVAGSISPVPESGSFALMSIGLMALAARARRNKTAPLS